MSNVPGEFSVRRGLWQERVTGAFSFNCNDQTHHGMKNHVDLDCLTLKEILATFEFGGAEVGEDCIRKEEGCEIYRQPGHLGLFLCFNQGYHECNVFTGAIT